MATKEKKKISVKIYAMGEPHSVKVSNADELREYVNDLMQELGISRFIVRDMRGQEVDPEQVISRKIDTLQVVKDNRGA